MITLESLFYLTESSIDIKSLEFFGNLPKEYIELCKKYDLTRLKTNNIKILIPKSEDYVFLNSFLNIEKFLSLNNFFYDKDIDDELIKNHLLIIADTSASINICIGINENNFGKIYLYGWDLGVVKIADTLQLFFDFLVLEESM
jgi:hypothetical protein